MTAEQVVATGALLDEGPLQTVSISRLLTDGVAETPGGAHFTACPPDYDRDEASRRSTWLRPADPEAWAAFSRPATSRSTRPVTGRPRAR